MIQIKNMSKSFDGFAAIDNLDLTVKKNSIYGLVGINGSGKTTIIKHLTGVLIPDAGEITIEKEPVFDNPKVKEKIGYVADDLYFFGTYSLKNSSRFYREIYKNWNQARYQTMVAQFKLDENRRVNRFSKGMQKQAAFILTMSSMPEYLVLDEPIDGLDPIIRKLVWKYIVEDVSERGMTVLVSSHNLRELEGICDSIGIISKGQMMIERDLDELKSDIHKIQVSFQGKKDVDFLKKLNVLHRETRGSVELLIVRDKQDKVEQIIRKENPVVFDMLPLSLEEVFIYELGGGNSELESIIF